MNAIKTKTDIVDGNLVGAESIIKLVRTNKLGHYVSFVC